MIQLPRHAQLQRDFHIERDWRERVYFCKRRHRFVDGGLADTHADDVDQRQHSRELQNIKRMCMARRQDFVTAVPAQVQFRHRECKNGLLRNTGRLHQQTMALLRRSATLDVGCGL